MGRGQGSDRSPDLQDQPAALINRGPVPIPAIRSSRTHARLSGASIPLLFWRRRPRRQGEWQNAENNPCRREQDSVLPLNAGDQKHARRDKGTPGPEESPSANQSMTRTKRHGYLRLPSHQEGHEKIQQGTAHEQEQKEDRRMVAQLALERMRSRFPVAFDAALGQFSLSPHHEHLAIASHGQVSQTRALVEQLHEIALAATAQATAMQLDDFVGRESFPAPGAVNFLDWCLLHLCGYVVCPKTGTASSQGHPVKP